jgi:hypothetical protein
MIAAEQKSRDKRAHEFDGDFAKALRTVPGTVAYLEPNACTSLQS